MALDESLYCARKSLSKAAKDGLFATAVAMFISIWDQKIKSTALSEFWKGPTPKVPISRKAFTNRTIVAAVAAMPTRKTMARPTGEFVNSNLFQNNCDETLPFFFGLVFSCRTIGIGNTMIMMSVMRFAILLAS